MAGRSAGGNIDADRVLSDAAVARQGENFRHFGIFLQRLNQGVFPSAAAHNHDLHKAKPPKA